MVPRRDAVAVLIDRRELSPSSYAIRLRIDGGFPAPRPGQFVMLAPLTTEVGLWRRAFSVAGFTDDPHSPELELMIRTVGAATAFWRAAPVGTTAAVLGPLGNGFRAVSTGRRAALVAGGIGLPPILFAAETAPGWGGTCDLYHGAASADELLDVARCADAAPRTGGELILATDDGSHGERGLITDVLDRRLDNRRYDSILACGPLPMLIATAGLARRRRIPAQLALEERMGCGTGVCLGCVVATPTGGNLRVCREGPVVDDDAVDWERLS